MKITIPSLAKVEVGYQKVTTFIYGQDPVTHDTFIHEYAVKAKVLFDKDLQIATRAIHAGVLSAHLGLDFLVRPFVVPVLFIGHLVSEAVGTTAELIRDVPSFTRERIAVWAYHASKIVNP